MLFLLFLLTQGKKKKKKVGLFSNNVRGSAHVFVCLSVHACVRVCVCDIWMTLSEKHRGNCKSTRGFNLCFTCIALYVRKKNSNKNNKVIKNLKIKFHKTSVSSSLDVKNNYDKTSVTYIKCGLVLSVQENLNMLFFLKWFLICFTQIEMITSVGLIQPAAQWE